MEIKELRIGNLLRDKISKTELTVTGIGDEFIQTYVIDRSKYPLPNGWQAEPIPITEEVLLKCGAKETESYTYEFTQIGKDIDLCVKFCEYDICVTIWQGDPIYLRYDFFDFYLHNLQNLIYEIAKKELTYNHSPSI